KSLRRCQLHSGHLYYEELPDCPWCELETYTGGLKLFNFLLGGADQERHQIQLDEIWREIESIPPPLPVWVEPLEPPEPSAEALACGRRRVIYERILLVLLALSAFAFTLIAGGATIFTAALAILVSALTRWVTGITTQHWRLFTGPAAKEIMQARRDAMARVRQLQAQWEEESQDEFFFGKLTDLQAQKRFYESLYLLREAKLEHLEAAARATQFDQYLDGFEIDGAEIDGVDAAVKSSLRAGGIATAADLTDHHLKQAPHVGRSRARKLLRWRQELERGFTFDPDRGPSPQAYLEVEKEIHGLRSRLERDLVGGAFSLRKMREEIEENRRSMSPEFADARHVLARAEADFNVAVKSRWLELAVPIMIIAFMFGSFFAWMRKDLGGGFAPSVETSLVDANGRGDRLVEEGRILLQMGQVAEAVLKLEEGARLAPQSQRAQEVLGDGLYQLKRYEESIAASKRAIKIYPTFESYYNLGRAHLARGSGKEAEAAFRLAMTHVSGYPGMERVRGLYPGLARSLIRQGVDEARIQALNAQSEAGRLDTFERLELATLYLYSGRLDEAQKQYRILKSMDPRVADDFKSLMKQRNGP
ncbi:MAG TPA: tetratricopeptide repeat protein, partial [Blastocatellia bacterium]|nr:tetratricopeptide repeat protein [Blastocatellia bacterium]